MRTKTRSITMPDGRKVKLTARFDGNIQEVIPSVEGPIDELLSMIGETELGRIPGVHFEGWLGYPLQEHGCTWENTSDDGDWIEWTE